MKYFDIEKAVERYAKKDKNKKKKKKMKKKNLRKDETVKIASTPSGSATSITGRVIKVK